MSKVVAYSSSLVVGAQSFIVCDDQDSDGDFAGYETAEVIYYPAHGGKPIPWGSDALIKIHACNDQGHQIVKAVIIPVYPTVPLIGCLGKLLHLFGLWKGRLYNGGSGTISGTLNPPPTPATLSSLAAGGGGAAPLPPKPFTLTAFSIFEGVPA